MHTALNPRPETTWRKPDARMLAVHSAWLLAPLGSCSLTLLASGGRPGIQAWATLAGIAVTFVIVTGLGLVRWRRTRYRVTADSFEIRTGVLTRRQRSVPLARIRHVDLTAGPLLRLLGLTTVNVGTAGDHGQLRLDGLARPDAAWLRTTLIRHAAPAGTEPVLAAWNPRWVRYAPLTFWIFGGVFAVLGTVYRILDSAGIEPWRLGPARAVYDAFGARSLWLTIPLLLLAIALVGALGALALYVENWWHFRVDWADPGTLRIRRGLFTTRSVSIDRTRLRGARLREPLLLRAGGGATASAVASGLGNEDENRRRSALLPPAPRENARRLFDDVLGRRLIDTPLTQHPRAALRRRQRRALLVVLVVGLVLGTLGLLFGTVLLYAACVITVLTIPAALWLAHDAYRSLGHHLHPEYLISRSGTFSRDTVAIRRDSVVAWTFTTTPFTRRAGLTTLTAATAAGQQAYWIRDLDADTATGLADEAGPGIITEFLVAQENNRRPVAQQQANVS
ncbi:PH domain-containing protein [Amycolatopsis taiwanensis]|uniref:PH domain-containing protein n=1 Tax=Amycolatopsis taiwanensis TaxID=342230 RepID=UPI0004B9DAD3|nr:PH domain-containing protein [Amycolatopsis taiwanensis]